MCENIYENKMKFNIGRPILAFSKSVALSFISFNQGYNGVQGFGAAPVVDTNC